MIFCSVCTHNYTAVSYTIYQRQRQRMYYYEHLSAHVSVVRVAQESASMCTYHSREPFELGTDSTWKLVKSNKAVRAICVRHSAAGKSQRLNRDRAIPQTGRFEASDKRCNNSAPVFSSPPPPPPLLPLPPSHRAFSSSFPLPVPLLAPPTAVVRTPRCLSDLREKPFVCKTNKNRLLARVSGGGGRGISCRFLQSRENGILITGNITRGPRIIALADLGGKLARIR